MSAQPMTANEIVGRQAEIAILRQQFAAAQRGAGSTLLISGEAGVGKSRLIAEISREFDERSLSAGDPAAVLLRGHSFEHDRALPYAPILDLLRSCFSRFTPDELPTLLGSDLPIFGALLPELATAFPGPASTAAANPEQDKHRLFHALLGLFTRLARAKSLLVAIEDLHWSDDTSLEFLLHLARYVPTLPILLLLTYRSDEITPSLGHTLALLDRGRLAAEIALPRLALADIDAMLRGMFGQPQPIRPDFLHAIHALTDGNPFFIEEVVRSLIATGDIYRAGGRWERRAVAQLHIPRSIQDAVMRRTRDVGPETVAVLRVAAVAGRFFDFDVLQALTAHDERVLLDLVRELVAAQLVVEESADRFAFRHALTRQAVYGGMLARERRILHLAVAEATERLHAAMPEPHLADLSYHFAAGEAWAKAMEYAERAGTRALGLYAPQAAVEQFSRAMEAAAHLSIRPSIHLCRERGQALAMLGEFDRALEDYRATWDLARADGDPLAEWRALLDLGGLWAGYDYTRAGRYFEEALALARTLGDPRAVAESLTQLGNWHLNTERPDEAEHCLQAALAIFERTDDRRGIARTIDLLGTVSDIAGDIAEMRRRYERAAALFRELGDRQGLSSTLATMLISDGAYVFETVAVPPRISPNEAMQEADEALSLVRDIGWRAGEAYTLCNLAIHLGSHGEYGRALDRAREGLAIAEEIDHREWMTAGEWAHGVIFSDLLTLPLAEEHFGRAHALARESGALHWLSLTAGYLAESRAAQRDLGGAEDALADISATLPMRTLGQRRIWTARAKIALARGDPAAALAIVERLFASAANLAGEHDIPMLALLRGQSLIALHRNDDAEEPLRAVWRITTDRGLRPLCWRSLLALGQLYTAWGRHADARAHFRSAWGIVEDLAATLPDDDRRGAFRARASALFPAARARTIKRAGDILTARERDVATLVARGLSNRDIADALSIGERTVETHVGNILGKLGLASRAQIAARATASGLGEATA